jgi:hypothetical protein
MAEESAGVYHVHARPCVCFPQDIVEPLLNKRHSVVVVSVFRFTTLTKFSTSENPTS